MKLIDSQARLEKAKGGMSWFFLFLVACLLLLNIYSVPSVISWGNGSNYRNFSVRTTVNVTHAYPEILNISCDGGGTIVLTAGSTKPVNCTVRLLDFEGGNTITDVNATFYYYLNSSTDSDDNLVHYTNASCTGGTPDGFYVNFTCMFNVWYYANNGTWMTTVLATDTDTFTASGTANASVGALYALNVTNVIDYGDLAVGDTTLTPVEANVTNFGNMNINVSVLGFGGETQTPAMNTLAMVCQNRNISISNERYSTASVPYGSMTQITSSPVLIPGLTVPKQIDASLSTNSTYWTLHVNVTNNPFGQCNGTVVFLAEVP